MGTDTDTQFLMSSDSGSKVQVGREKRFSVERNRAGWGEGEADKADEESERDRKRGDERSCNKAWSGKSSMLFTISPNEMLYSCHQVRRPSGSSLFGTNEVTNDFVMVDLKTPFAAAPTSA